MILGVSDVRKRVEAALEEDERTADYAIEVVDQDGLITLKGQVGSVEDKQAAEEIAEAQEGVIEVANGLTVVSEEGGLVGIYKPEGSKTDEDKERDVLFGPPTTKPTTPGPSGGTVVPLSPAGLMATEEEETREEEEEDK